MPPSLAIDECGLFIRNDENKYDQQEGCYHFLSTVLEQLQSVGENRVNGHSLTLCDLAQNAS
jgi:hypothetical protein